MAVEWVLVTAPTIEPVTLAEIKRECRIDTDDENERVAEYLKASRQEAEQYLSRGFLTQTWKFTSDDWAERFWLPMAMPLQSVTSVQYYNGSGVLTTLATSEYVVDTTSEPGSIIRAPNVTWPTLQNDRRQAVVITYVVGWAAASAVPANIRQGIAALTLWRHGRMQDAPLREAALRCLALAGFACWRPPAMYRDPVDSVYA